MLILYEHARVNDIPIEIMSLITCLLGVNSVRVLDLLFLVVYIVGIGCLDEGV